MAKSTQRKVGEFVVDKTVPFPGPVHRWKNRWPFANMEIGESFAFPAEDHPKAISAASYYGSRNNMRFSIRKVIEDGVSTYRCWRVE